MVIYITDDRQYRLNIILHIRHFHIADCAARGKLLELCFKTKLLECVNVLCYMDMIAVSNITLIRNARNNSETLL